MLFILFRFLFFFWGEGEVQGTNSLFSQIELQQLIKKGVIILMAAIDRENVILSRKIHQPPK